MHTRILGICLLLISAAAAQQKHKVVNNAETPEGLLLQQIGQETDETKKLALIDDFLAKYPKNEGAILAYSQAQPIYLKQKQFDKAMEAGDKALAIDPDDLDIAYNALKAAEGKKDADNVIKWSERTSAIAKKTLAGAKPDDDDEAKQRVDYAKQVNTYTEYALYSTAMQTTNQPKVGALVAELIQRNPKSEYL